MPAPAPDSGGGSLPYTGTDAGSMARNAAVMCLLGAGLVAFARRRREAPVRR